MRIEGLRAIFTLFIILASSQVASAQEKNTAVVQAILFYRPTCPHCHEVIENHLPRIKGKYGDQLQIVGIDTSNQVGAQLYSETITALNIPSERRGVPTLVIGDVVLVGGQEIPDQLPELIEQGLTLGGIGWPNIPGLKEAIPNLPPSAGSEEELVISPQTPNSSETLLTETLPQDSDTSPGDPLGFAIGWIVMTFMIVSIVFTIIRIWPQKENLLAGGTNWGGWMIPLLTLAGLGISAYLAYVEISRVEAVCGPIGECNIVQSSPYAQIFGIPVAVLGLVFYAVVVVFWLILRFLNSPWTKWIPALLLATTFLGTVFSIYLTLLELLVIKAICAWCLSSAVITTTLLILVAAKITKSKGITRHKKGKRDSLSPVVKIR